MTLTQAEENYLKAIFSLNSGTDKEVTTNVLACKLHTKASSVTDMLKKLARKKLVHYQKYKGVQLTEAGKAISVKIIRRHRLWEVFLVKKLYFGWDEVHDIAEQLEHIKSDKLTDSLDAFLNYPTHDPHGDPIPDRQGVLKQHNELMLKDMKKGDHCIILGIKDTSTPFLQYLDKLHIEPGIEISVLDREEFDNSMLLKSKEKEFFVSDQIALNLYVKKINS